jgi:hypothetical protein
MEPVMEPIPFERASVEEAREVFDRGVGKRVEVVAPPEVDWSTRRRAKEESDRKLLPVSVEWLRGLPHELRPVQLALQFPHIVNKLAQSWSRIGLCEAYFDELLIIKRGTRQGFPFKVLTELNKLKDYKDSEVLKGHIRHIKTPG